MKVSKEAADLLLLSKSMLDKIRFQVGASTDRYSLAVQILTAHDASELALSAVAYHTRKLPGKTQIFLMDYFEPLKSLHPEREVDGKEYFSQLNRVRNNLKHHGLFPDPGQWAHVGERVYSYISEWCSQYLGFPIEELDQSILLEDEEVKALYDEAKELLIKGEYKLVLEKLAHVLKQVFDNNTAVRGLAVGIAHAEDAIKLTGFGVDANDFLTLQQFLPKMVLSRDGWNLKWEQEKYGHPGNWHEEAANFCLESFLDIALKIQRTPWIPGPIHFAVLYEQRIEVLKDKTEVWNLPTGQETSLTLSGNVIQRTFITTLSKGDVLRGSVSMEKEDLFRSLTRKTPIKKELFIITGPPQKLVGYIAKDDVRVTCVPLEDDRVKELFGTLPEIEWQEPD